MSLRPFFEASLAIQIHQITAILAFLLGAFVLWRRKGTFAHRVSGMVWVVLMMVTAFSSLFIHELKMWGDYSAIHLLTLLVLVNMPLAIWYARRGNIHAHQMTMKGTYIGGMLVAGGLTFLPGRLNYEILAGGNVGLGSVWGSVIGIGAAVLVAIGLYFYDRRTV